MSFSPHAALLQWSVADDCLVIAGQRLPDLAESIGRTPFYAYDRCVIERRVAQLRDRLASTVQIFYAVKANPMPQLVRHLIPLLDGLDVASAGELKIAIDAGADVKNVSFAGPGKTESELNAAAGAGILISLESQRAIGILEQAAQRTGNAARIAIRVNPDYTVKAAGVRMGGGASPFGIDSEKVPETVQRATNAGLRVEGFHVFTSSQTLSAEAICDAHLRNLNLMIDLAQQTGVKPSMLNIGGGLGIPYFPGDQPLDIDRVCDNLRALSTRLTAHYPDARLVIELGRYLVGEAGIYVCRVLERKISRGQVFLVTDGGMHHHLAATGHFGQVVRRNYPVVMGNRMGATPREVASIVGPLCTPLDLLADKVELPEARAGDLVVVFQSGAYGLTASPTAFLSHPKPAEVFL